MILGRAHEGSAREVLSLVMENRNRPQPTNQSSAAVANASAVQPSRLQPTLLLRIHWGWVLIPGVMTYGLFLLLWLLVQAQWVSQIKGRSKAVPWAVANLCFLPFLFLALIAAASMDDSATGVRPLPVSFAIAVGIVLALYFTTISKLRTELRAAPFGMELSGPKCFLGGPIYFQAKFRAYGKTPLEPGKTLGLT
jgi:hypothetical protein